MTGPDAPIGREDLSTTQQYIRVTGRELERAMARLKAGRDARDSVALEVSSLMHPAKPRPEQLCRASRESDGRYNIQFCLVQVRQKKG
jgi:hypothetical protein